MVQAGVPGILQALVVVAVVWFFAMWLCRKLKVDDEFAVILGFCCLHLRGYRRPLLQAGPYRETRKNCLT
ncbi:MAG: hypothetical protein WDO16_14340 [Bacteroidota bacterium]